MNIHALIRSSILILIIGFAAIFSVSGQENEEEIYNESCTSIMLGKKATDDGSVITAHTCDAWYRTWLDFVPAQKFEDSTTQNIYSGTMHTHTEWSRENIKFKGKIPQIKETYTYLNTAYPCINEKQLAIGETTFGGKKELRNKAGLFEIENLERIALQRCSNAREAIKLIGELIK